MIYEKKTKTTLTIISLLLLLLCCLIGSASAFSGEGSGTEDDPYLITTVGQLQEMNNELSAYYQLEDDIDCSSVSNWTPIGNSTMPFTGHLIAQEYVISNVTITASSDNVGLFGVIGDSAYIEYLNLEHVTITGNGNNIGALCGCVQNTNTDGVEFNCCYVYYNEINVTGNNVGGVIGLIQNCSETVSFPEFYPDNSNITANGNNVGGMIGCVNSSNVNIGCMDSLFKCSIIGNSYVGGLIGNVVSSTVECDYDSSYVCDCTIRANNNCVGGIIGYVGTSSTVKLTEGYEEESGISPYQNCISCGSMYAGGVIGYVDSSTTLCQLDGMYVDNISIKAEDKIGGFVGYANGTNNVVINDPILRKSTLITTASNGTVGGIYAGETSACTITNGYLNFVNLYGNTIYDVAPTGTWTGTTTSNITHTDGIYLKANSTGDSDYNRPDSYLRLYVEIGEGTEKTRGIIGSSHSSSEYNCTITHTDGIHSYTDYTYAQSSNIYIYWKNREYGTYTSTAVITNDFGATITVTFTTEIQPDFLGSGTEEDPYQITNATQFIKMRDYNSSKYFILMNDIDFSGVTDYTPFGAYIKQIDGNYKTIKNLTITTTEGDRGGIFVSFNNGTIKNCTFDNITHNASGSSGIGLIAGILRNASFVNVTLQNSSVNCSTATAWMTGGFGAYVWNTNYVNFDNCTCKNITLNGDNSIGAFIGYVGTNQSNLPIVTFNGCIVDNCNISASSYDAAGFVGNVYKGKIIFDENCVCKNSIMSEGNGYALSGFVGSITEGVIKCSEGASEGQGAKVINCCLKGANMGDGGIVGYFNPLDGNTESVIDGCVIDHCSFKGSTNGGVIGMLADTFGVSFIHNPTVSNSNFTSGSTSYGIIGNINSTPVEQVISGGSVTNLNLNSPLKDNDVAPTGSWTGTTTSNISHVDKNINADSTGTSSFNASTNKVTFQVTVGGVNGYEGCTVLSTGNPFTWSHTDGTHTYTDTVALDGTGKATIDWTGREYGIYTSTLTIENELGSTTVTFSNIPIYLPLIINVSSSASKIQPSSELTLMCYASGGLDTTTYEWKQGTTVISTEQNPTITVPEEEGTYTYSVTVTNASTSQTKTGEVTVKVVKVWNDTEETVTKNMTASFILVLLIPLTMAGLIIFMIIRTGEMDYKSLIGIGVLIVVTIIIVILAGSIDGTVIEGIEKLR